MSTVDNQTLVLLKMHSGRLESSLPREMDDYGTVSNNPPRICIAPMLGYRSHDTRNAFPGTCVQPFANRSRGWGLQNERQDESPFYNNDDDDDDDDDDDEMFPIMSSHSRPPTLELNHALVKARDELSHSALRQFLERSWTSNNHHRRARSWTPSSHERHSSLAYNNAHAGVEQERGRGGGHTAGSGRPTAASRALACPFYRHSPVEHSSCLRCPDMRSIEDLVQNLVDAHHQRPFCPICNTLFDTSESCDEHIRRRRCSPRAATWPRGITHREAQEIIDQTATRRVPAVQWFVVWGVIFPDEEPPSRPYLSGGIESAVRGICDFWAASGRALMSDFLGGNGNELRRGDDGPPDEEGGAAAAALYHAVRDQMVDQLVTSYEELRDGRVRGGSRAAQIIVFPGSPFFRGRDEARE